MYSARSTEFGIIVNQSNSQASLGLNRAEIKTFTSVIFNRTAWTWVLWRKKRSRNGVAWSPSQVDPTNIKTDLSFSVL